MADDVPLSAQLIGEVGICTLDNKLQNEATMSTRWYNTDELERQKKDPTDRQQSTKQVRRVLYELEKSWETSW